MGKGMYLASHPIWGYFRSYVSWSTATTVCRNLLKVRFGHLLCWQVPRDWGMWALETMEGVRSWYLADRRGVEGEGLGWGIWGHWTETVCVYAFVSLLTYHVWVNCRCKALPVFLCFVAYHPLWVLRAVLSLHRAGRSISLLSARLVSPYWKHFKKHQMPHNKPRQQFLHSQSIRFHVFVDFQGGS